MSAPAFGSVKKIKFIDAVIELPEYTDKIPGIAGIALGERDDGKLDTFCVRFLPGTRLEMSSFVVGNEINLHYSTSHKRNDERLAAAVVAENQSDFRSLVHSSMIDDFGDPNLRQLICQSCLAEIGTFKKVFDISSCSVVRIKRGVLSRQSFFDAKYEQALIAFDAKWSLGTLDSYLQQRSFLNNVVFANDSIGEWFIETGKEDLAKYVSGSPKTVLNTLQQYEGWEERNVESFTNLCNKVNEEYGELKKIEHRESTFNKETRHWTIRFDLVFEKREHATGYAEYAIKNASPALFQISFD